MSRNPREQFDPRPKRFLQYGIEKTGPGELNYKEAHKEARKIGRYLHRLSEQLQGQAITFDSLFDVDPHTNTAILTPDGRQAIEQCALVIAHNQDQHCDELICGFEILRQIVRRNRGEWLPIVRVVVNHRTNEFHQLVDAVRSVKGSVDWHEDSKEVYLHEEESG